MEKKGNSWLCKKFSFSKIRENGLMWMLVKLFEEYYISILGSRYYEEK